MRWLWQYGSRWLLSRVWQTATKRPTADAKGDRGDDAESTPPVADDYAVAVVCPSKWLFNAVADVLTHRKQYTADRFEVRLGRLAGRRVLVARPTGESPDLVRFVSAIVEGHRPRLVLSASEAESLQEEVKPGHLVVADRVFGADHHSLRLEGSIPPRKAHHRGGIASRSTGETTAVVDSQSAPLAADDWSWPVARACQQVGVPLVVVGVVVEPGALHRSQEVTSYKKQSSLAGKAGALTGMAWKKRSGLKDLWKRQEAGWEASERLVRLVRELAEAMAVET